MPEASQQRLFLSGRDRSSLRGMRHCLLHDLLFCDGAIEVGLGVDSALGVISPLEA